MTNKLFLYIMELITAVKSYMIQPPDFTLNFHLLNLEQSLELLIVEWATLQSKGERDIKQNLQLALHKNGAINVNKVVLESTAI